MINLSIVMGRDGCLQFLAEFLQVHKYLVFVLKITTMIKYKLVENQISTILDTQELETDLLWALLNLMENGQRQDLTEIIAFDEGLITIVLTIGKSNKLDTKLVE